MHDTFAAGPTVIRAFKHQREAERAATRLHAAGFSDVRLSERTGETREQHVAPVQGHTASDFAETLVSAGFSAAVAQALTNLVERGDVLVTVAAGDRSGEARIVLEGGTAVSPPLGPVDVSAASTSPEEIPPDADAQVVRTHGEVLDVERRRAEGEARIRRETVTEQKTITVPVQHEELVVERDGSDPVRIPVNDARNPNR